MAVATIGNKTYANPTPGATTLTVAHTQNTGSNRGILVSISHTDGATATGATYGGVSMTAISGGVWKGLSQRTSTFFLSNPAEGSNNVVITFNNPVWTPLSFAAYSFTGCGGYGNVGIELTLANPTTIVLSCSQDSLIFARGQSNQTAGSIVIDGVTYSTMDFQHNTNNQAWGVLGTNSVASGDRTITLDASSGDSVGTAIEILGAVSTTAPTVTTTAISNIGRLSASSGGDVTADGGASVTDRGVCWNTSTDPTTANSKTTDGTGTGSFTSSITSLSPNTLYYVRAYATNSVGTSYGSNISFRTTRRIIIT